MKIQFVLERSAMLERLGIMGLSSLLKRDGHEINLLITDGLKQEEIIKKVRLYNPRIIAYSIMTGEHKYAIALNTMLKRYHNFFSVFGGPHPTFMPAMIEKENVDAICIGEGDIAFPELVKRMEQGVDYHDVNNFWFKNNGEIIKNQIGPLVANLDDLPFPDRKLMYEANPAVALSGYKAFTAMRGCPFMCTYCFNHSYNAITKGKGAILRYRSVDNLIREIREIKERYCLERVHMYDDTFLLKPEGWLEEFAERFPKEIGLPFSCSIRVNLASDTAIRLLKKINCKWLAIGVECGNQKIANTILKRNINNEQIKEACRIIHKYRIKLYTQNLVGLPVDNPLDVDLETLDFNISLKPYYVWSSLLYPYPQTEIGKLAIQKGLFEPDFDKTMISNKTESCLNFDRKIKRKINNLHKLFGIIAEFPILRPIAGFLISLPLTSFYTWLYFAFYGYKFVWKNSSWKERRRTLKYYLAFYFRYVPSVEKRKMFTERVKKGSYPVSAS